eukprot:724435-Alexandrium_andersonii.AAC.1
MEGCTCAERPRRQPSLWSSSFYGWGQACSWGVSHHGQTTHRNPAIARGGNRANDARPER